MSSQINTNFSPSSGMVVGAALGFTALACTTGRTGQLARKYLTYAAGVQAIHISVSIASRHYPPRPYKVLAHA